MTIPLFLTLAVRFWATAQAENLCAISTPAGATCTFLVDDAHPTQSTVGLDDVDEKADKMIKLAKSQSAKQVDEYLRSKPVDIVIGPNGSVFGLDGHHFMLAALYTSREQFQTLYGKVEYNQSSMSLEKFYAWLKKEKLYWAFRLGEGPLDPDDLPNHLDQMVDDKYRSLASAVRNKGGFKKSYDPHFEYLWSEWFRQNIVINPGRAGFAAAVEAADHLARSDLSLGLPGHLKSPKKCSIILSNNKILASQMRRFIGF